MSRSLANRIDTAASPPSKSTRRGRREKRMKERKRTRTRKRKRKRNEASWYSSG
jgi:hypothetical protein